MTKIKQVVYKVTKGKNKGMLVVKTNYEMPKKIFCRGIKPLPFNKLLGYNKNGVVTSSVRISYTECKVLKSALEKVGTVMIPPCFIDANGMCKPDGFQLLT